MDTNRNPAGTNGGVSEVSQAGTLLNSEDTPPSATPQANARAFRSGVRPMTARERLPNRRRSRAFDLQHRRRDSLYRAHEAAGALTVGTRGAAQ